MFVPQIQPENPHLTLDPQQRQVVNHAQGAMRVLGAAGSGKTEALIAAVLARLGVTAGGATADAASPGGASAEGERGRVLVLTYDKFSANRLREHFARKIGSGSVPLVRTFHSFALGLVRHFSQDAFENQLRLLSAAEQDPRLRVLLEFSVAEGRVTLPAGYEEAMGTRGLAEEVRRLIAKAQQLSISPPELRQFGVDHEVVEWESLAPFLDEYLSVIASEGSVDYSGLFGTAEQLVAANSSDSILDFDAIFVDEYQDIEPAQVALLTALYAGLPAAALTIFGNPDQMIFRFKGARPESLAQAEQELARKIVGDKSEFETVLLSGQYRCPSSIVSAASVIVDRVPLTGYSSAIHKTLRGVDQEVAGDDVPGRISVSDSASKSEGSDGGEAEASSPHEVTVASYFTRAAQEQGVAETVRELKLRGWVERWSDIAVIARSGSRSFATLQQTLIAAGVPTTFVGSDVPLRNEPGVADILRVLRAAKPEEQLTPEVAHDLALSPLGDLTPSELRQLSRQLRDASEAGGVQVRSASESFARALADQQLLASITSPGAKKAQHLASLLDHVRSRSDEASAQELLWDIWSWTDWPENLATAAKSQQSLGRAANRTLDAVVALFEVARRSDRVDGIAMSSQQLLDELAGQSFSPGDAATQSWRDSVQLLSAHSVKGRSWRAVIVVDLQEDSWPQVAQRASLLKTDQLSAVGYVEPLSMMDQIRDERRLLYSALTRASEYLYVTCVADSSNSTSGSLPSRFFTELQELAVAQVRSGDANFQVLAGQGQSARALTTAALVAQFRATLEDQQASDALKHAAANRLALMQQAGVTTANPDTWWGVRTWTQSATPVRPTDEPLKVSGSMWKSVDDCALQWFLQREAGGATAGGSAAAFGSVVHALADAVAKGEAPADLATLMDYLGVVWHRLGLDSPWQEEIERNAAISSLTRFLNWQDPSQRQHKLIATEQEFNAIVQLDDAAPDDDVRTQVQIRGIADRLEVDEQGATHVLDLKNEKNPPSQAEVAEHQQLKLYQLAVEVGAFDGQAGIEVPHEVGGAALVQLRHQNQSNEPKLQNQGVLAESEVKAELLQVVEQVRDEQFGATEFKYCDYCAFRVVCPIQLEGREVGE